ADGAEREETTATPDVDEGFAVQSFGAEERLKRFHCFSDSLLIDETEKIAPVRAKCEPLDIPLGGRVRVCLAEQCSAVWTAIGNAGECFPRQLADTVPGPEAACPIQPLRVVPVRRVVVERELAHRVHATEFCRQRVRP